MNRFYFRIKRSPTYYNIAHFLRRKNWSATKFPFLANFGEKNLDFNQGIANQLEYKHLLSELIRSFCPDIMPKTYLINDHNWMVVLDKIRHDILNAPKIWILKPSLLNNGQNISLFDSLEDVKTHFLRSNRLGGEHVLQEYITSPHLLKDPSNEGHKYSIRMFMVLTNYDRAFLYPHGYFNIAISPYNLNNIYDLSSHITNEYLTDDTVNVIQAPTFKYDLFKPMYLEIKNSLIKLTHALKAKYPDLFLDKNSPKKIAIFGVDFIVDSSQKIWLIEANHGPCFPIEEEHKLQNNLYAGFWDKVIEDFVQPISEKISVEQINYSAFEPL